MRVGLTLALILLAGCLRAPEPSPPEPTTPFEAPLAWTTKAPFPEARTEVACAATETHIYVVGGITVPGNAASPRTDIYDLAADRWTRGGDLPAGLHHLGLVAHGGTVYAFGGYMGTLPFVGVNTVLRYDTTQDAWTMEATLPRSRGAHAAVLAHDEVYLVGGAAQQPGNQAYAAVDVYHLATKAWRQAPDLSRPREHLAGAAANGTVAAVGGRLFTFTSNSDALDLLTPGAARWAEGAPMPTPRGGLAATSWNDRIIAVGGEGSGGTFADVEAFDATTGTWTRLPGLPTPRHGLCAVATAHGLHVIAGGPQPGFSASTAHELLAPEDGGNA